MADGAEPDPEPAAPDAADGAGGPEGPASDDSAPGSEPAAVGDPDPAAADPADTDSDDPAPAARTSGPRRVVRPVQPTHTYVYHDGGEVVETVILKDGDTIVAPADPNRAGKRFDGWCEDEALERPFAGFGGEAAGDGGTTHLYAKFTDVHYFTYYDEAGKVIECEMVELGQSYTFYAQSPQFTLASDTARNDGWRAADGTVYGEADAYPGGQTITVTGDLDLRPVPQEGFYAHFHSQGGSATVSQFIHEGGKVARPADPTRQGYAFAGWYDAPEGGNPFDFDHAYTTVPSEPVEIYAHWTEAQTTYSIALWLEQVDGSYEFSASIVKACVTGGDVSFDDADKANSMFQDALQVESATDRTKKYTLYLYEDSKNANSVSQCNADGGVLADGSTVVNVYARRKTVNVSYRDSQYGSDLLSQNMRMGDRFDYTAVAPSARTDYRVTFPSVSAMRNWYNQDFGWTYQDIDFVTWSDFLGVELSDGQRVVIYNLHQANTAFQFERERYLQNESLDGFVLDLQMVNWGDSATAYAIISPIEGFSVDHTLTQGHTAYNSTMGRYTYNSSQPLRYYLVRNKYSLEFVTNNSDTFSPVAVTYGTLLSSQDIPPYEIGDSLQVSDNGIRYVFRGWYDNAAMIGDPVDFDAARMPSHGLRLYAKWEEEQHAVTYDPMGGSMEDDLVQTVRYGQRLEEPAEPVRHGYRFVDWHLVDGSDPDDMGQPYVFRSPVTDDMTLRAHWVSDVAHTIVYKAGEGSGSVPSIGTYLPGSTGRAQSGDALVPPAGKRFAYWLSADGSRYYPGELVPVESSDVVLTAQYSPAELTGLAYDLNYSRFGIAAPVPDQVVAGASGLLVNSTVRLRDPAASEVPDGWGFAGWYLDAACSGEPLSEVM